MKTKINLLVREIGKTEAYTSIHVTNTEMFMPPRITETIIFQGDIYNVVDIIHDYDKHTIKVMLIDTGVF